MNDHVYRVIEVVGSSTQSSDDAIRNAVERAGQTVRDIRWIEVMETRGHVEGGLLHHFQVTVKIGFTLDEKADG